jgi:PAT family beta-lactamase induction signal transducer AmpG
MPARRSRPVWVSTTYFAEGLPFMLVRFLSAVYLTDIGLKERYLGFLNFLNLPWNLKFLWAPAVDLFGTKRGWLLKVEAVIVVAVAAVALFASMGPAPVAAGAALDFDGDAMWAVNAVLAVLVGLAFVAATHDISIDAYYMEAITDAKEQAAYTGLRVLTYRVAVIFTKSVLVAIPAYLSWTHGWLAASASMAALLAFHAWYLPRVEKPRDRVVRMGSAARDFGRAFSSYLAQPRVALVLAFVVTYKLGDEVLFSMNTPFLMREVGVTKEDLSWLAGIVGTAASIAGSLVSAWALKRFGLKRAIWPLTLSMNLNIWAYVWLAWALPDPATPAGLATVAAVHAYEQFAAGLGNAVLIVFIMRTCNPEFKAAHYAVASAIASLGGTVIGGFGGVLVEAVGYVNLYLIAFAAALPSMACMLFLPMPEEVGGRRSEV